VIRDIGEHYQNDEEMRYGIGSFLMYFAVKIVRHEPIGKPKGDDGKEFWSRNENYWLEICPFFARLGTFRCVDMMFEFKAEEKRKAEEDRERRG
jgi:hypothetical protein